MAINYIGNAPEYIVILTILWLLSILYKRISLIILSLILSVCVLWFFQGASSFPNKIDPTILYSPCEGIVSDIVQRDNVVQICIFLNIHNTRVQYSPFDCTIKQIRHKEGAFHPAYLLQKSQYNERTEYILQNATFGEVTFVQIAGQLARRIVTFVKEGHRIDAMTPIGLIKLGSRCDIFVKGDLLVKKGDCVCIGDPLVRATH
jgi:phosphatidylserine decarboxylase